MGIKRIVDTSFWTDGKVDEFSPEDKYFMLYLLTNPFSKQLGIYEISIKQAAFQMGYSIDAFNVLLERFENKYNMILFSRDTNEIAILNFLRHSVMKGGKPVEDCIKKEMALVKDKKLIEAVFSRLHGRTDLKDTVKRIVAEYINENDIHNDNDNDNDNENESTGDVTYPVTPPYRPNAEKPRKKKSDEVRHQYGEYKNVLLSDKDLDKLKSEFPDWEDRIERLSSYMKSAGKTYADHLATIRNWARKDTETGRKEIVPKWMNKQQPDYNPTPERIKKNGEWLDSFLEDRKKADIQARAEQLKQRLAEQ